MGRAPGKTNEPQKPPSRVMHPRFRTWLGHRLKEVRCESVGRHLDRAETIFPFLSPNEMRRLPFQEMEKHTGYARHLLRETAGVLAKKAGVLHLVAENGTNWWSLALNPFKDPFVQEEAEPAPEAEQPVVAPIRSEGAREESAVERLYRRGCDAVSQQLSKATDMLEMAKPHLAGEAACYILDAVAEIQGVQRKLTRIAAAGVRQDPAHYLEALLNEWRIDHGE